MVLAANVLIKESVSRHSAGNGSFLPSEVTSYQSMGEGEGEGGAGAHASRSS